MQGFEKLIDIHSGRDFLITCTGKSTGVYWQQIKNYIDKKRPVTIGMNNISRLYTPMYHLFTNNDRIKNYYPLVSKHSKLLIGSHIKKIHRPDVEYTLIKYTDRDQQESIKYTNNTIYGYYRVSGLLAVMVSHLMGARKVYLTGLDSFAENAKNNNGCTHFCNEDMSNKNNSKTVEEWRDRYDKPMLKAMCNLREYGIDFSIITPTAFKGFYENTLCLPE